MTNKLNTKDIINHMENGATLRKTYCVYSYWSLYLLDGTRLYNFRKNAPESAKSKISYNIISQDKTGYSITIK
jgi:hypothetical protein